MCKVKPDLSDIVDRFLSWRLPDDFAPDCGIEFKPIRHPSSPWPIGTNLLNADQAETMLLHLLDDALSYAKDGETISGCIERNRKDISRLLGMLTDEKLKCEQLAHDLKYANQRINSLVENITNDG